MVVNTHKNPSAGPGASIFLDYGADGEKCDERELRVCERGMCFKSRWQFDPGAELAIALTYRDRNGKLQRADLRGVIAECEKVCRCCFRITLLFVDLPESMQPVIRQIASLLTPEDATEARQLE